MKRHVCKKVKEPPLHVCRICKKMFSSYTNLKEHQRLHSDSLDYPCNNCGQMFRWHTSLTRHECKCLDSEDNVNGDELTERNDNFDNDHDYTSKNEESDGDDSITETSPYKSDPRFPPNI